MGLLGPRLHLADPALGLLDLLESPAEIDLLAHQKAEGTSEHQPGRP